MGFLGGSAGKESTCDAGDLGSVPGLGRSPGEDKGYPPQYSGLENSTDSLVHGVTNSQTQLSDFHLPWRRGLQPTPVFLPGESPWREEPGGLRAVGSQHRTQLSNQAQHHSRANFTRRLSVHTPLLELPNGCHLPSSEHIPCASQYLATCYMPYLPYKTVSALKDVFIFVLLKTSKAPYQNNHWVNACCQSLN